MPQGGTAVVKRPSGLLVFQRPERIGRPLLFLLVTLEKEKVGLTVYSLSVKPGLKRYNRLRIASMVLLLVMFCCEIAAAMASKERLFFVVLTLMTLPSLAYAYCMEQ